MITNFLYRIGERYHQWRDGKLYVVSIRNDMSAFPVFQSYSKDRALKRFEVFKKWYPHQQIEFDEL